MASVFSRFISDEEPDSAKDQVNFKIDPQLRKQMMHMLRNYGKERKMSEYIEKLITADLSAWEAERAAVPRVSQAEVSLRQSRTASAKRRND